MSTNDFFKQDLFEETNSENGKKAVLILGIIAYVIVLIYTGVHSYNLIVSAVAPNLKWIATIGVIALELNAIALPLAIHFWTHSGFHRMAAFAFYAVDLVLLYANSQIDARIIVNGTMPPWGEAYLNNFAQASPLFTLVVWSVLFSLDPVNVAKEKMKKLIAYTQEQAINSTAEYLKSDDFKRAVARRGDQIGEHVLRKAFTNEIFEGRQIANPKQSSNGRNRDEFVSYNSDVEQVDPTKR